MTKEPIVLIADDDETDVLFLRKALLESCPGISIFDVGDGEQAVAYLAGTDGYGDRLLFPLPTHIFLDIKMPRLSGLEVLRWLRQQPDIGLIPVTVLSGSQLESDRRQALALGADYVVKPIEFSGLLALARQFCARAGAY